MLIRSASGKFRKNCHMSCEPNSNVIVMQYADKSTDKVRPDAATPPLLPLTGHRSCTRGLGDGCKSGGVNLIAYM